MICCILYDEKPHFFLRSDEFEIDELINHQYKKQIESNGKTKTVVIESKKYFGQLGYYLRDCKSLQKKIQKIRLLPEDMVNLIDEYNSCN